MLAAALAPAKPVPTTMTSNLRLLAGLTSFISNRCRSHFWASGPPGILASSFMSVQRLLSETKQNGHGNGAIAHENRQVGAGGKTVDQAAPGLAAPAQRLEPG